MDKWRAGDSALYNFEDILRGVFFLKDVPYSLQGLENVFSMTPFEENEIIVTEGELGLGYYVLLSGKVLLFNKSPDAGEVALQTLEPPHSFGELNLLDPEKWPFSAKALESSILCYLERNVFLEYIQGNPLFLSSIISNISAQLRRLEVRNKVLTNINAKLTMSRVEQEPNHLSPAPSRRTAGASHSDADAAIADVNHELHQPHAAAKAASVTGVNREPENNTQPSQSINLAKKLEQRLAETTPVQESVTQNKTTSSAEMLYNKKTVCPLCQAKFESPKVLSKYIQVEKIDQDFCKHHKFADPLNYEINVCPYCGYAFNEETMKIRLKKDLADEISANLSTFWGDDKVKNYCQERSVDDALETFLLTLYCLKSVPIKKSQLSLIHLKIAWLYRNKGEQALEQEYLNSSLENLTVSFEKESATSVRAEINSLYLLGVLNFQTGKYNASARWLERILRHKSKTAFPLIVNQARDIWAEVRAILREEKEETAEDNS